MADSELSVVQAVYLRFGKLSEEEWEAKWNTLRKSPQDLDLGERALLLRLFCIPHFAVRPAIDLEISDYKDLMACCTGWVGLALRSIYPADAFNLAELVQVFHKRPPLIAALLFGTRDAYLQVMRSPVSYAAVFELTDQQSQFLQKMSTDLNTHEITDTLRQRMNRAQQPLAEQTTALMAHYGWFSDQEHRSPEASQIACVQSNSAPTRTDRNIPPSWLLLLVIGCFSFVIRGLQHLKFLLNTSTAMFNPDLIEMVMPLLNWGDYLAVYYFSILMLAALLLVYLQKRMPLVSGAGALPDR